MKPYQIAYKKPAPSAADSFKLIEVKAINLYNSKDYVFSIKKFRALLSEYKEVNSTADSSKKCFGWKVLIARCYEGMQDTDKAIAEYEEVIREQPLLIYVASRLTTLFFNKKDYEKAKSYAELILITDVEAYKALTIPNIQSPPYVELTKSANIILGNIAIIEQNFTTAIDYFDKAEAYLKAGELSFELKDYIKTIEYIKKARKSTEVIKDTESDWKATYYWGLSLIFSQIKGSRLTYEKKGEIVLGIKMLDKVAQHLNYPDLFFDLAYLYTDKILVLENAAEKSEQYFKQAFNEFSRRAEHEPKCQPYLARCYRYGLGCEQNLALAQAWAEKSYQHSNEAKEHLACLLYLNALSGNKHEDALRAIELFTILAEEDNASANFYLALIYEMGTFKKPDYHLAEIYYRNAISLGVREAADNLLIMYFELLKQLDIKDESYQTWENNCAELIKEVYADTSVHMSVIEKAKEMLKQKSIRRHQNCRNQAVFIRESISSEIYSNVRLLSRLLSFDMDEANTFILAYTLLKSTELLDSSNNGLSLFKRFKQELIFLLRCCQTKLTLSAFSIRGLCHIVTGVARLYRYGFEEIFDNTLSEALEQLCNNPQLLTLIDVNSIFSALLFTHFRHEGINKSTQSLLNYILAGVSAYVEKQTNLSSIFYAIAVIHNYAKCISLNLIIDPGAVKLLTNYAVVQLESEILNLADKSRYFYSVLYFCGIEQVPVDTAITDKLVALEKDITQYNRQGIQISKLQNTIYTFLNNRLVGCEQEVSINTLPVDIRCRHYLIQVDGPHHSVFSSPDTYALSAKDKFHDRILTCNVFTQTQADKDQPNIVIHLAYDKCTKDKEYAIYVESKLKEYGLEIPQGIARHRQSLFSLSSGQTIQDAVNHHSTNSHVPNC